MKTVSFILRAYALSWDDGHSEKSRQTSVMNGGKIVFNPIRLCLTDYAAG